MRWVPGAERDRSTSCTEEETDDVEEPLELLDDEEDEEEEDLTILVSSSSLESRSRRSATRCLRVSLAWARGLGLGSGGGTGLARRRARGLGGGAGERGRFSCAGAERARDGRGRETEGHWKVGRSTRNPSHSDTEGREGTEREETGPQGRGTEGGTEEGVGAEEEEEAAEEEGAEGTTGEGRVATPPWVGGSPTPTASSSCSQPLLSSGWSPVTRGLLRNRSKPSVLALDPKRGSCATAGASALGAATKAGTAKGSAAPAMTGWWTRSSSRERVYSSLPWQRSSKKSLQRTLVAARL